MDIDSMIKKVKANPDYHKVGMILCHNGVVRRTTREGREVTGLSITVDHEKLDRLIASQKAKKRIIEVLVEIVENKDLDVGEDVMYIVVAGDIRDNVIETLTYTLNTIKTEITSKKQFLK